MNLGEMVMKGLHCIPQSSSISGTSSSDYIMSYQAHSFGEGRSYFSEKSHCVPHSYGVMPHLSKKLSKLLLSSAEVQSVYSAAPDESAGERNS